MSGLSRQLPWAAACLAALCVLTAAQDVSPDPNVTAVTTLATTKSVPTSVTTLTPVTIPAQGGGRPNGLPALARPPSRAACPARGARGARAGRAPATWRPVRVQPGPGLGWRGWGSARRRRGGRASVAFATPSAPRRHAFKKCLVIPSLTSRSEEGTWLPPAVAAVGLIMGRGDSPPKLLMKSNPPLFGVSRLPTQVLPPRGGFSGSWRKRERNRRR